MHKEGLIENDSVIFIVLLILLMDQLFVCIFSKSGAKKDTLGITHSDSELLALE